MAGKKPQDIRTCVFYNPDDKESGCIGEFRIGRSDSDYCPACRANMGYWNRREKKAPGAARRYRHKLTLRSARMDEWMGATHLHTHGKVVSLIRRRRHG